ncbi:MAG: DUF427 domain-containing protein [Pseudomonadota bacterium]
MAKAVWKGALLADSEDTVVVEGNHYFPKDAVNTQYFEASEHTSFCPWKGTASYHDITVDGEVNKNAVWHYPDPKQAAAEIKDRFAFWHGVEVTE